LDNGIPQEILDIWENVRKVLDAVRPKVP